MWRTAGFLVVVVPVAVLLVSPVLARLLGGGFYSQPSTSMEPALPVGSAYLTRAVPAGTMPERGTIVVFAHPQRTGTDFVKRVVAVAGDRIAVREGLPVLNGTPLSQRPEGTHDVRGQREIQGVDCVHAEDEWICPLARLREALPGGRSYHVLDSGETRGDHMAEVTVPEGHVFVMGDHRDNSIDSRFPGLGLVPVGNLKGVPWRFYVNFQDPGASLPLFLRPVDPQP